MTADRQRLLCLAGSQVGGGDRRVTKQRHVDTGILGGRSDGFGSGRRYRYVCWRECGDWRRRKVGRCDDVTVYHWMMERLRFLVFGLWSMRDGT